jgi:hypothetical protein
VGKFACFLNPRFDRVQEVRLSLPVSVSVRFLDGGFMSKFSNPRLGVFLQRLFNQRLPVQRGAKIRTFSLRSPAGSVFDRAFRTLDIFRFHPSSLETSDLLLTGLCFSTDEA